MIRKGNRQRAVRLLFAVIVLFSAAAARAAGPRWVAGPQWTNDSKPMGWYLNHVHYFVDQGPLSASVDNATATALVDAAAAVWDVQGVNFSLTNGGTLNEDVSGGNVYLGSNGPVWPADVQSTNYSSKQIAVIFDADGAITDTLLGAGASAPSNCRQNGVTESVDLFIQPGNVAHALIVINGRCSGPAPEQQLQLQYQMERVFGRVIGLGWSQTNDNVFTGTPAPIYVQQAHWPIMHPIDILCGPYTYQCLPQPFTLRDDDVASLEMLYAADLNAPPGPSQMSLSGRIVFPTGEGMSGINVVVQRNYNWTAYQTDPYQDVSSVSGFLARTDFGNPVTGGSLDVNGTAGGSIWWGPGYFLLYGIPSLTQFNYTNLFVQEEALNPLYTGPYAVGPYRQGSPAPSGTMPTPAYSYAQPGSAQGFGYLTIADAASQCNTLADGIEDAPAAVPAEGVWSGRLCGVQHTPWSTFTVRAGRSATIDVTALDESGVATEVKALPVIGLWHGTDASGSLPVLAQAAAFDSISAGTTQLRASFASAETVRIAIADQRGDGRPDYTFRARLLYADSVSPSRMVPGGGTIRITGTGFTPSSTVTVGGVVATVTSLSSTEIIAAAPTLAALGNAAIDDVTVTDRTTGADTTISGGLTYSGAANDVLTLVVAPPVNVAVGASAPFVLKLLDSSGNPAANSAVDVSVVAGAAQYSACGLSACTLLTDASGWVQTQVTPTSPGTVQLQAVAKSGSSVQVSFNATQPSRAITFVRPVEYVAAGASALFTPSAVLTGSNAQVAAQAVAWTANSPRIQFGGTHASGNSASVSATGSLGDGEAATVQACGWGTLCATQNIVAVSAKDLQVVIVSGDAQSVSANESLGSVTFRVTDVAGHPVAGATVALHQEVTGWQPPCDPKGRCAPAPVYGTSSTGAISDDDGLVSVTPMQYASTAAVTKITAATGISGVASATLQKTP